MCIFILPLLFIYPVTLFTELYILQQLADLFPSVGSFHHVMEHLLGFRMVSRLPDTEVSSEYIK